MVARLVGRRLSSSHSWDRAREVPFATLPLVLALWRLAIDAGADRCRYRLGFAAHPRRNDGAEAAGRASRGHDQEMIRRFERGMDALAAAAHDRALPHVGPFRAAHTGALVQEVGDVTLGPARPPDRLAQLFRDDARG